MNKETKPNRLDIFGDSLFNKLKGMTRKRRKREASKKRRQIVKGADRDSLHASLDESSRKPVGTSVQF